MILARTVILCILGLYLRSAAFLLSRNHRAPYCKPCIKPQGLPHGTAGMNLLPLPRTYPTIAIDRPLINSFSWRNALSHNLVLVVIVGFLGQLCLARSQTIFSTASNTFRSGLLKPFLNLSIGLLRFADCMSGNLAWVVRGWSRKRNPVKLLLSLDRWAVCKLVEIRPLDTDTNTYKFEIQGGQNVELGLDVGQQVVLYCIGADGRALTKSFYPVSDLSMRGAFEVLGSRGHSIGSRSATDFDLALLHLDAGEEICVRKDSRRLMLPESAEHVEKIRVIANGPGIFPALQLLRSALDHSDSCVRKASLLWINDDKKDFVLNSEVEELQRRHDTGERLSVSRVVDRELGNPDTLINSQLHDCLPAYEPGVVGVVFAEGLIADKCNHLFARRGYPQETVGKIEEPSFRSAVMHSETR